MLKDIWPAWPDRRLLDEQVLGPESVGLPIVPSNPTDPQDIEGRKWFRAAMTALCIVGFAQILVPDAWRPRLVFGAPEAPVYRKSPKAREVCATLKLQNVPYTYRECRVTDGNGRVIWKTEAM